MDPKSNDANVTVIYNRLTAIANVGPPAFGLWGLNFMNLHFHGMDFSPKTENLRTHVDGGKSRTLVFKVPDNKEPGLFWYHNHVHGTAVYSYLASLFGLIIVEGNNSTDITSAVGVNGAKEILMLFSDGLVNPDGSVPTSFPVFANFNWTGVTNGNMGEKTTYKVTQGETVVFRAASATSESILRLSIPNTTFSVLAYDGLVLSKPETTKVVTIPGGGRAEFAARFDVPGTYIMKRAAWSPIYTDLASCTAGGLPFYPCWSFDKEQVAATIVVTAEVGYVPPAQSLDNAIQLPKISSRLQSLATVQSVAAKSFTFQIDMAFPLFQVPYSGPFVPPGVAFGVNSRLLTPNHVEGSIEAGTCETWTVISNPPGVERSFHIHQANFLVKAIDGVPQSDPRWHDAITIQQNATLHMCFDRAEGGDTIMAHCHAPNHFDIGMGAMYNVTARSSPYDNTTNPPIALVSPSASPSMPEATNTPSTGTPSLRATNAPISVSPTAAPFRNSSTTSLPTAMLPTAAPMADNATKSPISVTPTTAAPATSKSPLPAVPVASLSPDTTPEDRINLPTSAAAPNVPLSALLGSLASLAVAFVW